MKNPKYRAGLILIALNFVLMFLNNFILHETIPALAIVQMCVCATGVVLIIRAKKSEEK